MPFKPRTMIGITLFVLLAAIALLDSRDARVILLAPAAVLFTFHTALYGLEYDQWTRKVKPPEAGGAATAVKLALLTLALRVHYFAELTELI